MYQQNFEAFDVGQPLLPGISTITLADALACDPLIVETQAAPPAEVSGETLLVSTDFRRVRNAHLEAHRVRFMARPVGEEGMLRRINWMWHAGSRSPDFELRCHATAAIRYMIDYLFLDEGFEPESLAEDLARIEEDHPAVTSALFTGDLDEVPDLIDEAIESGADEQELVRAAAWMFVTWGALEQQREACLGHRLIHCPLDGVWGAGGTGPWTIGKLFRPHIQRHRFAHEMMDLYHANLASGAERIEDKRTIARIERTLSRMGVRGINRANEQEVFALFGQGRMASIPVHLSEAAGEADAFQSHYEAILAGPDGSGRAGQRPDMMRARISAVHRTAIVCARTYHLASLAADAAWTGSLRAMLDREFPEVLRPATDRQPDEHKSRLRQLFHLVRVEFLRDGEHLRKVQKGWKGRGEGAPSLDLEPDNRRRGHEIFDICRQELDNQPTGWRFITPFGWQCDGAPRITLTAPPPGPVPPPAGCSLEAIDQFRVEWDVRAPHRDSADDGAPSTGPSPGAAS